MAPIIKCAEWVPSRPYPHFCNRRESLTSCDKCGKVFCGFHTKKHKEY